MIRTLWFGETLKEAIDSYRIHHQLIPMNLEYEAGFPLVYLNFNHALIQIIILLFWNSQLLKI